jgi:hypothetical protein
MVIIWKPLKGTTAKVVDNRRRYSYPFIIKDGNIIWLDGTPLRKEQTEKQIFKEYKYRQP